MFLMRAKGADGLIVNVSHLKDFNEIEIFIFFTDPPEINVESPVVYSGEGQEAMLVCIVHGEAAPDVSQ
jgi:hypothetical protein